MTIMHEQVEAGAAAYTKQLLSGYDLVVLRISNRFIWKCPSHNILELYNQHVSANHLDVGVGTGYFLNRCNFPSDKLRLGLLDLNTNCLEFTANRLSRYTPEKYRANVLEPIAIDAPKFDSVGMGYLLHCLPGTIRTKATVFENLKALLNPGGVLFGSTLLYGGVDRGFLASRLMKIYNARRIFTNMEDDLGGLKEGLEHHFSKNSVQVIGCAAMFWART